VVRWGTRVHGRLPIPNLLFHFFSLFFGTHLKLSHFTRERLPHVRDFFMSQTPTSKPLCSVTTFSYVFMHNRGRPTTLFLSLIANSIFLTLRTLMKWLCQGLQDFFSLRGIVCFFLAYPFSFRPSSCLGLDFTWEGGGGDSGFL
jgi:hypothetical protein